LQVQFIGLWCGIRRPTAHHAAATAAAAAMAAASPRRHAASACIFDLDGLILDTEMMCADVAASVLRAHGAALTPEASKAAMGKRPLDCWRDVVAVLKLQVRRPAE